MTVTRHVMVSEGGYVAGVNQSLEHPLGGAATSHARHLPGCALNESGAADMAHELAEVFRRDSGCLLNEHERAFAADRKCRAKAAGARGTRGRGYLHAPFVGA